MDIQRQRAFIFFTSLGAINAAAAIPPEAPAPSEDDATLLQLHYLKRKADFDAYQDEWERRKRRHTKEYGVGRGGYTRDEYHCLRMRESVQPVDTQYDDVLRKAEMSRRWSDKTCKDFTNFHLDEVSALLSRCTG